MFTTKPRDGAMIRNYAITLAPVALQMTLRALDGATRLDLFDALRNAALLSWIPSLLIVQRGFHDQFGRPASASKTIVAVLAVVIVATSWAIASHDPVTLELAPASTAIVRGGVTT